MRILVAGGAGFIGSHLTDALLKNMHEVICIDNLSLGTKDHIAHLIGNDRFQFYETDLLNMEKVDEIVGDLERNVITFKKFSPDAEIYFGKTEGFNEYKGKDLAVIGTPHNVPFLYNLIGAYLGYRTDDRLSVRYVENGMYAFPFMTFRDKEIRNLQFYFIESELEQAIGRARILRHDCTVYLFSNFPCRQAQLRQEICFPEE